MTEQNGARVLVVDDEDTLRRHTRRHLERAGYACDTAGDASEARDLLTHGEYEVVLCDVNMPGESGLSLIEHITATHPDTRTVMISGLDDTETAKQALQLGAVGYVVKPFERNELLINVANALHRRDLELRNKRHQARLEELIKLQANYDLLTGLANRQNLTRYLNELAELEGEHLAAILFLDLDHLKVINDSLGHEIGDDVLREVAGRLRKVAPKDSFLARFGGDTYVIVLPEIDSEKVPIDLAETLLETMREPHEIDGRLHFVTASLGISFLRAGGQAAAEAAVRDADAALYQAKTDGRATYQVADELTRQQARRRLETEQDLRRALDNEELLVHYQPKFDLRTDAIVGLEALVRWDHPGLGVVYPTEFIPIAEETRLIVPLGTWVLQQSCADLARFRAIHPDYEALTIAVNVSAYQLARGDLVADVRDALEASGLAPGALTLEMTESVLIEGVSPTLDMLLALKDLGVRLSIDDFGTGYSSLSYIARLPVDEIKIDRSFLVDLESGGGELVAGVISLAHAIGHEVVAEGIETEGQLEHLREHGCELGQGYLLAYPEAADKVTERLVDRSA
jgi:diguanylate cyclase (GGDEF)-like protein